MMFRKRERIFYVVRMKGPKNECAYSGRKLSRSTEAGFAPSRMATGLLRFCAARLSVGEPLLACRDECLLLPAATEVHVSLCRGGPTGASRACGADRTNGARSSASRSFGISRSIASVKLSLAAATDPCIVAPMPALIRDSFWRSGAVRVGFDRGRSAWRWISCLPWVVGRAPAAISDRQAVRSTLESNVLATGTLQAIRQVDVGTRATWQVTCPESEARRSCPRRRLLCPRLILSWQRMICVRQRQISTI